MQMPSGYIAGIWSAQKLLSIGMLICGVLNVVMPIAANQWDLPAVLICRVGMGLTQACLLPCAHTLLSKWAPPSERARLGENRFRIRVINVQIQVNRFANFFA
jgi:MFS family permease